MRWLGPALALLLAACRQPALPMPDQSSAMTIVWNEQYGMTVEPPPISWVTGSALNCGFNDGGWESADFIPPLCVAGESTWQPFNIQVAWPAGSVFSTTAFAHELCHLRDGVASNGQDDLDLNHTGECFVEGGLVQKANEALAEVGL